MTGIRTAEGENPVYVLENSAGLQAVACMLDDGQTSTEGMALQFSGSLTIDWWWAVNPYVPDPLDSFKHESGEHVVLWKTHWDALRDTLAETIPADCMSPEQTACYASAAETLIAAAYLQSKAENKYRDCVRYGRSSDPRNKVCAVSAEYAYEAAVMRSAAMNLLDSCAAENYEDLACPAANP